MGELAEVAHAVPGLPAKPIIDIVLAVPDSADEPSYLPALEAAGYVLRIREPDWYEHRLFKGPDTNINMHVFSRGAAEIDRMLRFRDHLRAVPSDRDHYARAKRELAARVWRHVQHYANAKTEVIEEIIARGYAPRVSELGSAVDAVAEGNGFAGVVAVQRGGETVFAKAYGLAHRAYRVPNTVDTRFAIASGSKALTALTVVGLIEQGVIGLATTARVVLGRDLPLVDDRVTVEHLLAHRSGIGDYLDEDADRPITDYLLTVPAQELADTEQYLAVLDGHPAKFPPGERFSYCNGGYVILALIAERVSGRPFHDLVAERVCEPAGMRDSGFFRSDELPERTAVGYLGLDAASRTNVFHLPVRGNGDGGLYSTVADIGNFWQALFAGRIVSSDWVAEMVRPRSDPAQSARYGLGFWLHRSRDIVLVEGYDAGVSFRSVHDPAAHRTYTVISNTSDGAWPIARLLADLLDG